MTSEHVTITEEVVKDGQVVTQERETLQWTPDPHDDPIRTQAMNVNHPDFIAAEDRVYTYDPETGMSTSKRREEPTEDTFPEGDAETDTEPEFCGHPIGNGTCALEAGHSGSHRMYV